METEVFADRLHRAVATGDGIDDRAIPLGPTARRSLLC